MKKGAIFDMDGLLFDTERLYQESWLVIVREWGIIPDPAFPTAVCGTSGAHMRDVVRKHYPEVDVEAYIQACLSRVAHILETNVPEKPGIHELLTYLHAQGAKIAVASSSLAHVVENNLRNAGVWEYFDAVVTGEQVKRGKPEPDIFLEAAKRLGLHPEECYVFEDGINGTRAGLAAGCATVMIPDLTAPTEDLRNSCAGVYPSLLTALEAIQNGML